MKTNVYLGIGIRIIVLFSVGMFWSYIPEHLTEFFGDKTVTTLYGKRTVWGTRHYWYFVMMVLLFSLSLLNVVVQCVKLVRNNYDTKKW